MKTTRKNKDTQVNQGFSQKDQSYLNKFDTASAGPAIQFFTEEELEDEEPEQRTYYCSFCKSKLDYLNEGIDKTIWRCNECMAYYDTNTQDMPLRDISSTRVKAYSEFQYYPTYDLNDPDMIFMVGVNPEEYDNTPGNVEILRDDTRVKHIRVRGSPVEAMAAMDNLDSK